MPVIIKVGYYMIIDEESLSKEEFEKKYDNKLPGSKELVEFTEELFYNPVSRFDVVEGPENEPIVETMRWIDDDKVNDELNNLLPVEDEEFYN